jgi:TRAP-type mannitol/chloroaromatic compound transport system permease small subunit
LKAATVVDSFAKAAERVAFVAIGGLLLLALATTVDIAMRYLIARPIVGFVEVSALVGAVLLSACMPHVLATRGNIRVDVLGTKLGGRWPLWLDRFGALVTCLFFSLMAWQYVLFAMDLKGTQQTIPVVRWATWPWWAAVAAMVVIAAIVGWATIGRTVDGAVE